MRAGLSSFSIVLELLPSTTCFLTSVVFMSVFTRKDSKQCYDRTRTHAFYTRKRIQDARSAYKLLEQSRRQNVHLQEANLWGGLLAKRLELARNNPDRARMGAAVWAPGKWAGVFVQDAYTKMEMVLFLPLNYVTL